MYPTVVIDNFFDDPKSIVNFSKKLIWYKPTQEDNWPGLRTDFLHKTNYNLFDYIVKNILSVYYNFDLQEISWQDVRIQFHKIKNSHLKNFKKINTQIHKDEGVEIAGVIYLNENLTCEETGTSIYNENLKRTVKVSNSFNTLLLYDAKKFHGVTSFSKKEILRLVIFIGKINSNFSVLQRLSSNKILN